MLISVLILNLEWLEVFSLSEMIKTFFMSKSSTWYAAMIAISTFSGIAHSTQEWTCRNVIFSCFNSVLSMVFVVIYFWRIDFCSNERSNELSINYSCVNSWTFVSLSIFWNNFIGIIWGLKILYSWSRKTIYLNFYYCDFESSVPVACLIFIKTAVIWY